MSNGADRRLDTLATVLRAERAALMANDVAALLRVNQDKLAVLALLETDPPAPSLQSRIQELSELNRANGHLLARRRRVVDWTLSHLGRTETSGYNAEGRSDVTVSGRCLASA